MKETLAHINYMVMLDCFELVPSRVGLEIFLGNPPMGASDQQDEVR